MKSIEDIIQHYKKEDKQMTNAAAIGYALLAAKRIGYSKEQLLILEGEIRAEMDFTTEEEAEEFYNNN